MRRTLSVSVFGVLSALASLSCGGERAVERDFNDAARQWREERPARYEFLFDKTCFCPSVGIPAILVVEQNTITEALDPTTREPLKVVPGRYETIDGLFIVLRDALDNGEAEIELIRYDESFGFPTRLSIDYIPSAMDDEVGYSATNFKAL
ncbi:MAG: DUF6174 domain-containing protein [Myxococcota bacterium]